MIIGAVEKKEKTAMLADSMRFRRLCACNAGLFAERAGFLLRKRFAVTKHLVLIPSLHKKATEIQRLSLRKERDSNPRTAFGRYRLSRSASSATRASFLDLF